MVPRPTTGIDEKPREIRVAAFTTRGVGDPPILPERLDRNPPGQEIASVTAGGAVDIRTGHDAIVARSSAATMPFRKNATPRKPDTPGTFARNAILRTSRGVGRTVRRRWRGSRGRRRAEM